MIALNLRFTAGSRGRGLAALVGLVPPLERTAVAGGCRAGGLLGHTAAVVGVPVPSGRARVAAGARRSFREPALGKTASLCNRDNESNGCQ